MSEYFDSIEIIMTIRSQKTIIPSYFTQEYFNIIHETPNFKDIGKWLKENFNEQIKDDDLIFIDMIQSILDLLGMKKNTAHFSRSKVGSKAKPN